jgi:hypothetical protein
MWVEVIKPDKTRMLINLETTFCFNEQPGGGVDAVSITGVGVAIGGTYEQVTAEVKEQLDES